MTGHLFVRKEHPINDPEAPTAAHDYPLILPGLSATHIEGLLRSIDPDRKGFPAIHIIDSYPMIADVINSTNAIGLVSHSYSQTLAFRRKFEVLPDQLVYSIDLVVARRARWLPTTPMTRFLNAVRRYPPS